MVRHVAHIDKVLETAHSASAAARSRLAASWRRSAIKHGLDPGHRPSPERIDGAALHHRRAELDAFLTVAAPRLDRLFGLVGQSGCAVLLSDVDGVILDRRAMDADEKVFDSWGLCPGAVWSEAQEGTNGIGTCLEEQRPVTIHCNEHFLARNTAISCLDAPVYDSEGRIITALDVSSARADQTEGFNRLIAAQVARTASAIEEAIFRAAFDGARIVVAESAESEAATLLAIDDHDLIVGATREARRAFGLAAKGALAPRPAVDVLGQRDGPRGFEKADRAAVIRALARADGNVSAAARQLGIGRATLYRRMKRLGIAQN